MLAGDPDAYPWDPDTFPWSEGIPTTLPVALLVVAWAMVCARERLQRQQWLHATEELEAALAKQVMLERVIAEQCGEELYTYIMGNAPVGFWDTNSGTDLRREFFMKAIIVDLYNSGPVDPSLTGDHIWVSKEELPNYITDDDDYLTFLQKLL